MKRYIVLFLIFLTFPVTASAELSEEALESIGRFLAMDFISVAKKQNRKPITDVFIVKEANEDVVDIGDFEITKEELLFVFQGDEDKFMRENVAPGKYKALVIINEVTNSGAIVRKAYINDKKQVFWEHPFNSLLKYAKKAELSRYGVVKLMDYEDPNVVADFFRNAQRGKIPLKWKPSKKELDFYIASTDVIWNISVRAPEPEEEIGTVPSNDKTEKKK